MQDIKKRTTIKIKVRLGECDPYGVANNASYLVWFECGRFDYAGESGYSLTKMDASEPVIYITLSTKCKYIRPAKFNDELSVVTWLRRPPAVFARYCFAQEIYNERGELIARCETENAAVDKEKMQVIMLKDDRGFEKSDRAKQFADHTGAGFL